MNYFEFWCGDYLRDTTELNLTEHGAYLRLLIAYYSKEKPLPAEFKDLYRITCAISGADKAATRRVADEFFPIADDGFRHKNRVDEEIAKAQKRIKIAQENGSKGGRKTNPAGNPPGNPVGSQTTPSTRTQRGARRTPQPGEALHTPHVIHQTPEDQEHQSRSEPDSSTNSKSEGKGVDVPLPTPVEVCVALKALGVVRIASSYAPLHEAIREGVTMERFEKTARAVRADQRTLEYIVGTARGQLADERAKSEAQQQLERKNHEVGQRWAAEAHDEPEEEEDHAGF